MKYGVIDIGSNTMRTVVFQVEGEDHKVLVNEKEFAEILSFVEDNALTREGIERLCMILDRMHQLCQEIQCETISAFATASLRGLSNQKYVVDEVYDRVGLKIDLLDGCEEAYYDYIGLKNSIPAKTACGFDLGGGSGQVFYYEDDHLQHCNSYPIGTLAMYNKFVKGLFPTSKERNKISNFVLKQLSVGSERKGCNYETLYGMGGTARALAKVHKSLLGRDNKIQGYLISLDELLEIDNMLQGLGLGGIKLLNRIIPERLVTFYPGLITISQLMQHTGAKDLVIVRNGVREGYVIENAINEGRGMNEFRDSKETICQQGA